METPKSDCQQIRTMRNHTPRLSERKKKLFDTVKGNEVDDDKDDLLGGIEPLAGSMLKNRRETSKFSKNVESLIGSSKKSLRTISFFETESDEGDTIEDQKPSTSRRSVRLSLKKSNNYSKSEIQYFTSPHKENIPIKTPTREEVQETKRLQKMFSNSLQITPRDKSSTFIEETSSEDEEMRFKRNSEARRKNKRHCEIEDSIGESPIRKLAKTATSSIDDVSISTKSFYSRKNYTKNNLSHRPSCRNLFSQTLSGNSPLNLKSKQITKRNIGSQSTSINRGVFHRVRRRTNTLNMGNKHYAPVDIDKILINVRNEKLRKLITSQREEKQQIEKIHSIFRKACNPIAMARPLSSISKLDDSNNNNLTQEEIKRLEASQHSDQADIDFSDIECDDQVEGDDCEQSDFEDDLTAINEKVIPLITYQADEIVNSEDSSAPIKKKFFKSGLTTTRKEIHLTDNIKATVTANGKLAILAEKKKAKKRKIRNTVANEFSDEQATIDVILRNLDDTGFGDVILPKDKADDAQNLSSNDNNDPFFDEIDRQLSLMNEEETSNPIDIVLPHNQDFNKFRKRIPFNTADPEIIERQHLLLDFLITNNICTEENFKIFVTDPDNHKTEAERIIDELVIVVRDNQNTDFRQRVPYNTTIPEVIEQQHYFLDFLLENNICTEENFDIFIANYNQKKAEATAILSQYVNTLNRQYTEEYTTELINNNVENNLNTNKQTDCFEIASNNDITLPEQIVQSPLTITTTIAEVNLPPNSNAPSTILVEAQNVAEQQKLFPVFYSGGFQPLPKLFTRPKQQLRFWNAGYGSNQYQIDAGQKAFGAHQCKQCGLVYTVHEPEEEKLHRDFHASLHVLRFKGWIDEDIVSMYPEWGPDGRILRLTDSSPPKRRERLLDILTIVDKELGFSSYIVPTTFIAYFAVRKMQIVGLCLVQPLDNANKYICVNGVDCCTEEQFEAKCGISRIWVSPLHRRCHIGSKLIKAVQLNTIFSEEVPLNKIAFSAPTELGKSFAQKITKTENFLVYQ